MVNVLIDRDSGRLASSNTVDPILEIYIEGTEPGASNFNQLKEMNQKNGASTEDDFYDLR